MRARRGMTLMELVIGMAITALMAGVGAAALGTIIDRQATITRANRETERAAALRETIRQWIVQGTINIVRASGPRGSISFAQGSFVQNSRMSSGAAAGVTAAQATGAELSVTTNAANPAMAPTARIRLFVDGDPSTPEQGLTIEYQATTTNAPLQRRQLDSAVAGMSVEFLDQRTGRWYDASQGASVTPVAVRLTLLPAERDSLPRLLALPIVVRNGAPQ